MADLQMKYNKFPTWSFYGKLFILHMTDLFVLLWDSQKIMVTCYLCGIKNYHMVDKPVSITQLSVLILCFYLWLSCVNISDTEIKVVCWIVAPVVLWADTDVSEGTLCAVIFRVEVCCFRNRFKEASQS
jgi:hypothetical protein